MSTPYRVSRPVRFAHCDPAGIVYYPRYFEIIDGAVEDWTEAAIGVTRAAMHRDYGLGLPTVDLHAKFTAVSRHGDMLDLTLTHTQPGRTSIALDVAIGCHGEDRMHARYAMVLIDLKTSQSIPWPAPWRARLEETA